MTELYDIHSHIIPEVDDGPGSIEEAKKVLKLELENNVKNIIVTPHYRVNMFETPLEIIREKYSQLKTEAQKMGINLYLGGELYANIDIVERLNAHLSSTMAGSRYVLVEFSDDVKANYLVNCLYSLLSNGYKPIVAHIERYRHIRKDFKTIEEINNMGAYIQINGNSVIGNNGIMIKHFCMKLFKKELVQFVASDCHGSRNRKPNLWEAYEKVKRKFGEDYAREIFIYNPQKIIMSAKK